MAALGRLQELLTGEVYTAEQLRVGLENPEMIASKINGTVNHWRTACPYNPAGVDVFEQDWDNLLILDACRYDEFADRADLPGQLESRISRGSTSSEFVRGNFGDKRLHDVAYVSANGWYARLKEEQKIDAEVYAFGFVERDAMGGITSRPATVADAGREALEAYPNKRLIVHFMQPHWPYLGPSGEKFERDPKFSLGLRRSDVTHEEVVQAYRENLDLVLAEVEPLLEDLPGKTVVTADHGELLGARQRPIPVKAYDHPEGVYVEELIKVPWHVSENGARRDVTAEEPITSVDAEWAEVQDVKQNLRDLGYLV